MARLNSIERWLLIGAMLPMTLPLVALLIVYDDLPHRIAIFHELSGVVTVWRDRTVFTVSRLPLMGIVAQSVALDMAIAGSKLPGPARSATVQFWVAAAWIILFEWGLESIEAALAGASHRQSIITAMNSAAIAVTATGVAILTVLGLRIWRRSQTAGRFNTDFRSAISPPIGIGLASATAAYASLVFFPLMTK